MLWTVGKLYESELVYWQLVQASYWERNNAADTTWTIERVNDICCHTEAKRKWKKSFFLMAFCSFTWLVLIFEIQIWTIICYVMLLQSAVVCVFVLGTNVSPAKTAEAIEMLFGGRLMWALETIFDHLDGRLMPSVLWRCWLGGRKGIRPVKNWVVGCWCGYLSGARCRLAYDPADATATHCLLLQ